MLLRSKLDSRMLQDVACNVQTQRQHHKLTYADCNADAAAVADANLQAAAREALQHSLQGHAGPIATLWLAAAHVAAWQRLPDITVNALGHQQRPLVLQWDATPPVSTNAAVATLLRNAASNCAGCMNLEQALQVTTFRIALEG